MSQWQPYKLGMALVGNRLKVGGAPGMHNEIKNCFNMRACQIPADLIGVCQLDVAGADDVKIIFRKYDEDNLHLWGKITNLTQENKDAGTLDGYMHRSRLRGMEVASANADLLNLHQRFPQCRYWNWNLALGELAGRL